MDLWTAFTIGLFGSLHCVGMCGPIAMALPGSGETMLSQLVRKSIYNSGRIITYSLLGGVMGMTGHAISLAGLQRPLSIFLGLVIIAGALIPLFNASEIRRFRAVQQFFNWLQRRLRSAMKKQGGGAMLVVGLLNGLLPCGFVYVGLAGSVTTGSIPAGMVYMALFGFGTFPAMMVMSMAPGVISLDTRRRINRYLPLLAVLLGLYLVYRGWMMAAS